MPLVPLPNLNTTLAAMMSVHLKSLPHSLVPASSPSPTPSQCLKIKYTQIADIQELVSKQEQEVGLSNQATLAYMKSKI